MNRSAGAPDQTDRALEAVARVRRVREQASLLGLQTMLHEVAEAEARLARASSGLSQMPPGRSDLVAFVASRTHLLAVGRAVEESRTDLESAENLAAGARAHWQHDKTQVRSIELLQERRAELARAEAARAEQQRLDEIATQLWSRHQGAAS